MYKLAAVIDGQQREVEVAEIPEAVFSQEARTRKYVPGDAFESELSRRAESIVKNKGYRLPDELVEDQSFVEKVSTKHNLKKGDAVAADEAQRFSQRLEAERKSWLDKDVTPLKTQLEQAALRTEKLVQRGLDKEILRSATLAGMKKEFVKDAPGRKPLAVAMFDGLFKFDPETEDYYVRDGQGFAFSAKATKDKPYMTIGEYMEQFANEKENAAYFEPTKQNGPGLNRGGAGEEGARNGEVVLTEEQARDGPTYQAALKSVKGDYSRIRVVAATQSNPFGG